MIMYRKTLSSLLVILRYAFSALHHTYCFTGGLFCLFVILPLRLCRPSLFWHAYHTLGELYLVMGTWYSWSAGYGVVEMGDDISPCLQERTLVLINHQCAGDTLIMWNVFLSRPGSLQNSLWILSEEVKFTPYGIYCAIRKDFFIQIGREKRVQGLINLKHHLEKFFIPLEKKLLVMFPEGGFLYKRRAKSQHYALQHNLPELENVCLPRLGATEVFFEVCNKGSTHLELSDSRELKWILDVTIAYPGGIPLSLSTMVGATRPPFNTTVIYRLYPASQVPSGPDKLRDWLYSRWQEKDKILSEFYKTGTISTDFCPKPVVPRLLTQNVLKHIFIHLFFVLTSYGFYKTCCLFMSTMMLTLIYFMYIVFVLLKTTKVI